MSKMVDEVGDASSLHEVMDPKGDSGIEEPGTQHEKKKKTNALGRKSRRKRKKMLQIEAVLAAVEQGEKTIPVNNLLPTDRDYQWPAVKDLCTLHDADKKSIIGQLGYFPGNAISVAARANEAFPELVMFRNDTSPLVLKLYPLVFRDEADGTRSRRKRKRQQKDDPTASERLAGSTVDQKNPLVEPFPTIYWVTHPRLKSLISKIELQNRGSQYEKKLQQDATALESMKQAHLAYGKERQSMLTPEDCNYIAKRRWDSALDPSRGVAGIRNYAGIKCLHAHAAHYWSGCEANVVGRWVADEVVKLLTAADATDKRLPDADE